MGFYYRGKRLFGLILFCTGAGMVLGLILPFWCLIALAGIGLICMGWYWWRK